jgi:hypothetical protein
MGRGAGGHGVSLFVLPDSGIDGWGGQGDARGLEDANPRLMAGRQRPSDSST